MTHDIEEYDHYVESDSLIWGFQVEEGGSVKDLDGGSASYEVVESPGGSTTVVDDSDSSVTTTVEPSNPEHPNAPTDTTGYVEILIDSDAINNGGTSLWQRLTVNDGSDGQKTFRGNFFVAVR